MDGFRAIGRFQILANILEEIGRQVVAWILQVQAKRRFLCGFFFARTDLPFFLHAMNDQIAARQSARGIGQRRINRPSDHAGEQCGLLQSQVSDGLSKIKLRGRRKTVVAMRQIHLIGVHGEDLRLCVAALDLQRQQNLLHFAAEADFAAVEKEVAGELHADGAGALRPATVQDLSPRGSRDAWEVDAPMLFKMLILDGRHRVVENFGALLVSHQNAPLQRKAADELPVIGIDLGDHGRTIGLERPDFRQVAGINKQQPTGSPERNGTKQQKCESHAVNQLPAAQSQGDRGQAQHRNSILTQMRILRWDLGFVRFPF
jgi:hypothetical protein